MAAGASNTQVLIAVIGVVGTISVALIANWDKLTSRPATTATAVYSEANSGGGLAVDASPPSGSGQLPGGVVPAPIPSGDAGTSDGWVEETLARIAVQQNRAAGTEIDRGLRLENVRALGKELVYAIRIDADATHADRSAMAPTLRALEAQVCTQTENFNLISRGAIVRYEFVDRTGVSMASLKITSCA